MNPLLFLLLLSSCLFAATDTIRGPGDPQFKAGGRNKYEPGSQIQATR
jgi:predicted small secreted protein